MATNNSCPVCGFDGNRTKICPSCGTQFGLDDFAEDASIRAEKHRVLREAWIAGGRRWVVAVTTAAGQLEDTRLASVQECPPSTKA